jgi:hypothetical protein
MTGGCRIGSIAEAAPGGAVTPTEGLTTRRVDLPMADHDRNLAGVP